MNQPSTAFFRSDPGQWFVGNDGARGPWSADACHAGPVTALLARAVEQLLPDKRLARLTAEFLRPIPMSGFRIEGGVRREGCTIAASQARLFDDGDTLCATATMSHVAVRDLGTVPTATLVAPSLDHIVPGEFGIAERLHDRPGFAHAIDVAYPAEQSTAHGPATMWMRTPALLDGEQPSPFQRLCPIADCGNGISRNAGLREMSFVNADLTVVCCRDPQSDWLASTATSFWEPTGVGLSTATIFDESGPVAMALQTLVLSRPR